MWGAGNKSDNGWITVAPDIFELCLCLDCVPSVFQPSQSLFTALPRFPLFSHTTLFSTWMPTSRHICHCLCQSITNLDVFCGSVWIRIRSVIRLPTIFEVYVFTFVSKRSIFSLKPKTIRKLTRNGVCVGPENMNNRKNALDLDKVGQ